MSTSSLIHGLQSQKFTDREIHQEQALDRNSRWRAEDPGRRQILEGCESFKPQATNVHKRIHHNYVPNKYPGLLKK